MNKFLSLSILTISLLTLCTLKVGAVELTVCASGCDFMKIQDAIDASASGDTILIGEGIYKENLITPEKEITLQGAGADKTIIDGGGIALDAGATDVRLTNSMVANNTAGRDGGGVIILSGIAFSQINIKDSVISNNRAIEGSGGGIYTADSSGQLNNTVIDENRAKRKGGGIFATTVRFPQLRILEVKEGKIVSNSASAGGGIYNDEYSELVITNSHIIKNRSSFRLIVRTGGGILNKGIVNIDDSSIVSLNIFEDCVGCQ